MVFGLLESFGCYEGFEFVDLGFGDTENDDRVVGIIWLLQVV